MARDLLVAALGVTTVASVAGVALAPLWLLALATGVLPRNPVTLGTLSTLFIALVVYLMGRRVGLAVMRRSSRHGIFVSLLTSFGTLYATQLFYQPSNVRPSVDDAVTALAVVWTATSLGLLLAGSIAGRFDKRGVQ